jgi:hypothetical protein
MSYAAQVAIAADRYTPCVRVITFRGLDLTGVALRMQVRLMGDTPGLPLVDLNTVSNAQAQGLKLVSVETADGLPVSVVQIRINETTIKGLPYSGERGDTTGLAYDLQGTLGGDKRILMAGAFTIGAGVTGADSAPLNRPYGYRQPSGASGMRNGATLTFGETRIDITIDGADLLASLASKAQQALDKINDFTRGPTGASDNTYTTYAALIASDPDRLVARLVPTIDETQVAGNFSYIDGEWLRQEAGGINQLPDDEGAVPLPVSQVLRGTPLQPEQFGAVGDGVADDTIAIRKTLQAIINTGRPGTLIFTPGSRYKCTGTITMDRAYHNVFGYALLDFTSWNGVCIHWTGSATEFGSGFGQNGCMEGQIVVKGSGNNSVGILYESSAVGIATHIRTVGVTVAGCAVSFRFGSRGYNHEFINCKSFNFGVCFDWVGEGAEDNDERISVFGGTYYNGGTFLRHKRPAGCFYAFSPSADYVNKLAEIVDGKAQWFGVHAEASNWVDGTIDVSGSGSFVMIGGWFLMQQNLGNLTHFVNVGAGASVKFENVITNNTNNINTPDAVTPTTWATGVGRFEMHNCEPAFEFGGFPARQHTFYSLLSDGEFERPLGEDLIWLREDTQPITSRYTGTNLQLTRATANQFDGVACLRVDKQFGSFSVGAFPLVCVPVRYGDKITAGFRVRTAPDRPGNDQRLAIRGGFAKLDGYDAYRNPVIARFSPPGEIIITPSSTGYTLVTPFNGASQIAAPPWATHYLIDVNTVLADAASWCFDGVYADRW